MITSSVTKRFDRPYSPVVEPEPRKQDDVADRAEELSFVMAAEESSFKKKHYFSRDALQQQLAFWRGSKDGSEPQEVSWLLTRILQGQNSLAVFESAVPDAAERYFAVMAALAKLDGTRLDKNQTAVKNDLELYAEELYLDNSEHIAAAGVAGELGPRLKLSKDEAEGLRDVLRDAFSKEEAKATTAALLKAKDLADFKKMAFQLTQIASVRLNTQLPTNLMETVGGLLTKIQQVRSFLTGLGDFVGEKRAIPRLGQFTNLSGIPVTAPAVNAGRQVGRFDFFVDVVKQIQTGMVTKESVSAALHKYCSGLDAHAVLELRRSVAGCMEALHLFESDEARTNFDNAIEAAFASLTQEPSSRSVDTRRSSARVMSIV